MLPCVSTRHQCVPSSFTPAPTYYKIFHAEKFSQYEFRDLLIRGALKYGTTYLMQQIPADILIGVIVICGDGCN